MFFFFQLGAMAGKVEVCLGAARVQAAANAEVREARGRRPPRCVQVGVAAWIFVFKSKFWYRWMRGVSAVLEVCFFFNTGNVEACCVRLYFGGCVFELGSSAPTEVRSGGGGGVGIHF
jgi:hypothetical protein